jgi:hypothetical protein
MAVKYASTWGQPIPTPKSKGVHALYATITNTASGDDWYIGYIPRNARILGVITRVTTGLTSSNYALQVDSTTIVSGISTASAGTVVTAADPESPLPAPSADYQSDPGGLVHVVPGGAYGTVSYQVIVLYHLV